MRLPGRCRAAAVAERRLELRAEVERWFAPTGVGARGHCMLRPPAVALLTVNSVSLSLAAFVPLILATVTYDGFPETPAWNAVLDWIAEDAALQPLLVCCRRRVSTCTSS